MNKQQKLDKIQNFEDTKNINRKAYMSKRERNRSSYITKLIKEKWRKEDGLRDYDRKRKGLI